MELNDKEMHQVNGGVNWAVIGGIAAAVIYLLGAISGYTNPTRCNNQKGDNRGIKTRGNEIYNRRRTYIYDD